MADPIAIVGLACRLPGGVVGPSSLWQFLSRGKSGKTPVPSSRYGPADHRSDALPSEGYFLQEDVRAFDNEFFGILNAEATCMDPQQRKLLEIVFECFENAGVRLDQLSGSNTGCYVGNFTYDFISMQSRDPHKFTRYSATGMGSTILSNRISHTFNLTGPSQVIDTACSASMYALHAAVAGLQSGDCEAAVVAGANLIQSVEQYLAMIKGNFISPTGTCHTFSEEADGYARGEGLCSLYLKRLSDAVANNDPIRAIIRGTSVGSNGKTGGISAPDIDAQIRVIAAAYHRAGVSPDETAFIECHGTGTAAGDPCEVEALSRFFNRKPSQPLLLGGIKPNVGHGEAVSGISSIVKAVLALERKELPQTIGVGQVNRKIKETEWNIKLATRHQKLRTSVGLPGKAKPILRASINSFGYGGANSHVILESADADRSVQLSRPRSQTRSRSMSPAPKDRRKTFLVPVSAGSPASLRQRVEQLRQLSLTGIDLSNLAYTLGCRRTHFRHRSFALVASNAVKIDTSDAEALVRNTRLQPSSRELIFVFTGQGAQWHGMGRQLAEDHPAFRRSIRTMDRVLQSLWGHSKWTIEGQIRGEGPIELIHHPERAMTVTVALQVALVELLVSWGISPKVVVGHSSGEIAAAFTAGMITSGEAVLVAYHLGLAHASKTPDLAMAAVGMSEGEANAEIRRLGHARKVSLACINSPENVTIAGSRAAVQAFLDAASKKSITSRMLNTGGAAYHHTKLDAHLEERLDAAFSNVPFSSGLKIGAGMISSVTGQAIESRPDSKYWRQNMESPVRFMESIQSILKSNESLQFIEIGPHGTLEVPISQIWAAGKDRVGDAPYSPTLLRGADNGHNILALIGKLFCMGQSPDFGQINITSDISNRFLPDLPPYPWSHDRVLWTEPASQKQTLVDALRSHELLGDVVAEVEPLLRRWHNVVQLDQISWLASHKVEESVVFPAAGFIAMALESFRQTIESATAPSISDICIDDFVIHEALVIDGSGADMWTSLSPISTARNVQDVRWEFLITSRKQTLSSRHATGLIYLAPISRTEILQPDEQSLKALSSEAAYRDLAKAGLNFGQHFQSLQSISVDPSSLVPRISTTALQADALKMPVTARASYLIHPIIIDALLQSGIFANAALSPSAMRAFLPISAKRISFKTSLDQGTRDELSITAHSREIDSRNISVTAALRTRGGDLVSILEDAKMSLYTPATQQILRGQRKAISKVSWIPIVPSTTEPAHLAPILRRICDRHGTNSASESDALVAILASLTCRRPGQQVLYVTSDINMQTGKPATRSEIVAAVGLEHRCSVTALQEDGSFGPLSLDSESVVLGGASSAVNPHRQRDSDVDIVLLLRAQSKFPTYGSAEPNLKAAIENATSRLLPGGMLITDLNDLHRLYDSIAWTSVDGTNFKAYVRPLAHSTNVHSKRQGLIVMPRGASDRVLSMARTITDIAAWDSLQTVLLEDMPARHVPASATLIFLIEAEVACLSSIEETLLISLRGLLANAHQVVWVTGGSVLSEPNPDFALASALGRSITLEQPSTTFLTLDVGQNEIDHPMTVRNLLYIAEQPSSGVTDFEFAQLDGLLHVSRISPDVASSSLFRQRHGDEHAEKLLSEVQNCRMMVDGSAANRYGMFEEITTTASPANIPTNHVEVSVDSQSLSAAGIITDADIVSCKSGTVVAAGSAVDGLSVGDEVIILSVGRIRYREIVPRYVCQKLPAGIRPRDICGSVPSVATAVYGLHYRARVEAGAPVLIIGGDSLLGVAAAQIAAIADMQVVVLAESNSEIVKLRALPALKDCKMYTLEASASLMSALKQDTDQQGFDYIVDCLPLQPKTKVLAQLLSISGSWIELEEANIGRAAELPLQTNMTLVSVSLPHLFRSDTAAAERRWASVLSLVVGLYRQGAIDVLDHSSFNTNNLSEALIHAGRHAQSSVSLATDLSSKVKVISTAFQSRFSPEKTYIIFGGLGGIGRSLARWMKSQGALHILLIGRSGTPSTDEAKRDIESLAYSGNTIQTIAADITSPSDVKAVLSSVKYPIGGVIHAAMALQESVFERMTAKAWHTVIDPKLHGCWNIHNALINLHQELDFFLMLSSVSGSIGQIAQSNYCAANHALDWFARYRGSLGLPGTAVALGMVSGVGYLNENPEVQAKLARSGITSLNEREVLHVIDIALTSQPKKRGAGGVLVWDPLAQHTFLTGIERPGNLETPGPAPSSASASGSFNPLSADPRLSFIIPQQNSQLPEHNTALNTPGAEAPQKLPEVPSAAATETSVLQQFAEILELDVANIDSSKSVVDLGIDSLLGTELRAWAFRQFRVDVSLFRILSRGTTVGGFVKMIIDGLEGAKEGEAGSAA